MNNLMNNPTILNNHPDTNNPYFPLDMDLTVLLPDREALDDVRTAHFLYDPPDQPLILSAITDIMDS